MAIEVETLRGFLVNWLVFRSQGFGRQKTMRKDRQDSQLENVIYLKNKQTKKQTNKLYIFLQKLDQDGGTGRENKE